jgi:hypothetical protein
VWHGSGRLVNTASRHSTWSLKCLSFFVLLKLSLIYSESVMPPKKDTQKWNYRKSPGPRMEVLTSWFGSSCCWLNSRRIRTTTWVLFGKKEKDELCTLFLAPFLQTYGYRDLPVIIYVLGYKWWDEGQSVQAHRSGHHSHLFWHVTIKYPKSLFNVV